MFKAGFFSCVAANRINTGILKLLRMNPDLIVMQGDSPYCNKDYSGEGYTVTAADVDSTVDDIKAHHDQFWAKGVMEQVSAARAAGVTVYYMADDHEWGGDNWDHTVTMANSQTPIGAVTQADVDSHWDVCRQAFEYAVETYCDNAANTDSGVTAEAPSEAAAAASFYPPQYFRQTFDDGLVEVFVIDCISHRSPIADTDDASKTMLGSVQKAWLKARLLASTATWKLIFTGKKTRNSSTGENGDTWGEYTTELTEIEAYIDSNGITGVAWLAGDKHRPHAISQSKAAGDTYDHVCVCACPIGVDLNGLSPSMTLENGIVWLGLSQCFGYVEATAERLTLSIRRGRDGEPMWQRYMSPGNNFVDPSLRKIA